MKGLEIIKKMVELLTTLTEESQNAAKGKCAELKFDTNRGDVSLEESFINLNSATAILKDAIEKQKLVQLPISVQKTLLTNIEAVSNFQKNLINGADEVVNLVNAIEQLNTSMWQYGLHNLSKEVLGYQTKLNQIKKLDLELKTLKSELESGINLKSDLERLLSETKKSNETLQTLLTSSQENVKKTTENLNKTIEISQNASAKNTLIQQSADTSTQLLTSTKTSNAEVLALEGKIKEFYAKIDEYRKHVEGAIENSNKIVTNNKSETDELISELNKEKDKVNDLIQKATGASLLSRSGNGGKTLAFRRRL
ncbi:MAG: hypothetical protein M1491_10130 [Deltaproteobacteria bacterium]|nr:hypothetical protein [Deltaproteobacteria bacterium]MCL5277613.1 hypothetical protein [Deltaproteobacteria bacterium]